MGAYAPKYLEGRDASYTAGGTITGGQVVVLSATDTCSASTAASAVVLGVATNDAIAGDRIAVSRGGVQRCIASAAIARDTPLKSAAAGKVAAFVVGTDPETQRIGFALTASTADGDVISVHWKA